VEEIGRNFLEDLTSGYKKMKRFLLQIPLNACVNIARVLTRAWDIVSELNIINGTCMSGGVTTKAHPGFCEAKYFASGF
jgi:hypothetical protein